MILCVHIHKGVAKYFRYGRKERYDLALRQAWRLDHDKADQVTTLVGFIEGRVVAVLENVERWTLSCEDTNPVHESSSEGRIIFHGGILYTELDFNNRHSLMYKKFSWGRGHKYLHEDTVKDFIR
ncbi:hypothetical protein [Vibrio harveyi]|uniref:hypothetical protein n=1 Tax=Vibrio harveyi TaxID=669 RepID=UPI003CF2364A